MPLMRDALSSIAYKGDKTALLKITFCDDMFCISAIQIAASHMWPLNN